MIMRVWAVCTSLLTLSHNSFMITLFNTHSSDSCMFISHLHYSKPNNNNGISQICFPRQHSGNSEAQPRTRSKPGRVQNLRAGWGRARSQCDCKRAENAEPVRHRVGPSRHQLHCHEARFQWRLGRCHRQNGTVLLHLFPHFAKF